MVSGGFNCTCQYPVDLAPYNGIFPLVRTMFIYPTKDVSKIQKAQNKCLRVNSGSGDKVSVSSSRMANCFSMELYWSLTLTRELYKHHLPVVKLKVLQPASAVDFGGSSLVVKVNISEELVQSVLI